MNILKRILSTPSNGRVGMLLSVRCFSAKQKRTDVTTDDEIRIMSTNWKLRCELATAYRAFEMYGMNEGICNHLTTRAPSLFAKEGVALIIPYGVYWSQIKPEQLVGLNLETGEPIEGKRKADITALSIHLGIYRNRPDVNSIMHLHPKYATTLAVLDDPTLLMISQNATRFANNLAYDTDYGNLADQNENDEGDRLGKALGDKEVLLMGNHGLVTVSNNVGDAFDLQYYFEKAAETQILAYQTGKPLKFIRSDIMKDLAKSWDSFTELGYGKKHLAGLQDKLQEDDPNFINEANSDYMSYA